NKRFNPTALTTKSYTFGQPRTGNKQFCRIAEIRLGRNHSRVVNRGDIVVGVPFVRQGFDHVRDFLQYDDRGVVIRRQQKEGAGWFHVNIPDHFMKNYSASADKNEAVNV
ncbi:MAG: hypothetical protein KGK17_02815, partial [Betaproteobacteria bacterium]|nr:hypothetical protein [Betaproteobacteria bacterium]